MLNMFSLISHISFIPEEASDPQARDPASPLTLTMVTPPRYVKTASVTNRTDHTVTVNFVFGSDEQAAEGNDKISHTITLAPAQTAAAPEQEYDMGGWTAVAALESFTVQASDSNSASTPAHYAPSVDTIVGTLHVDIHPEATGTYKIAVVKQE